MDKGEDVMRIAVTYENGEIFQHFGHTEQFKLYDVENGEIKQTQVVDTNGQGHGALSSFLTNAGVEVLICGGIGGGAQAALAAAGIQLLGGVSGKGGVGKSLVTSLLAASMRKKGYKTAVLDADITGPSIPKMFGLSGKAQTDEEEILPVESANGTKIMSVNLLLDDETDPVIWRGPLIAGTVKQFWTDVC